MKREGNRSAEGTGIELYVGEVVVMGQVMTTRNDD
jgi:hypothetical protein